MTYTLTQDGNSIIRDADGATIPVAPGNRDYREYLEWGAAGNTPTPYTPPPISVNDVIAERAVRLAAGFDYTFPNADPRGTITIQTTDQDRAFWEKVTTMAQTYINAGQATATFDIYPAIVPVTITAAEWFDIIAAWTAWEQPIILGSFWLQAQNPIPADYKTNNAYWSA